MIALAAAGLVVADVATYSSLRSFLIDRVDRSLDDSAHSLRGPLGPRPGSRARGPRLARRLRPAASGVRRLRADDAAEDLVAGPQRADTRAAQRDRAAHHDVWPRPRALSHRPRHERRGALPRARLARPARERDARRRDVAGGRRLDARPAPAHRALVTALVLGGLAAARAVDRARRPPPPRRDRHDGRGDRSRRPVASRRARRRADGGRPARPRAQCDARADRVSVPRARGIGAQAPAVRRRRVPRAAHAARGGPRLRRAVHARRIGATRRPRTVDDGHQPGVGAHDAPRRRPPPAGTARRGTTARAGARRRRRCRHRGGRDGAGARARTARSRSRRSTPS